MDINICDCRFTFIFMARAGLLELVPVCVDWMRSGSALESGVGSLQRNS